MLPVYIQQRRAKLSAGFSLVEIMVGMVIGLISLIVILQIFSIFEGQKRTTTGGDDAQNNAAIALYGVQRDIQLAGYGVSAYPLIGCTVTPSAAGAPQIGLVPVTINPPVAVVPAGDANTDTLLLVYSNANGSPLGDATTSVTSPNYQVKTPTSFTVNDYVVAEAQTRPSPCNLTLNRVITAPGVNPVTVATNVAVATGDTIYNLGQVPKILAYAIRGGDLKVCNYMTNNCSQLTGTNWVSLASNIVSMRAQYGRDAVAPVPVGQTSYIVANPPNSFYDQATPSNAATLNCDWTRIVAVRIALVARNGQLQAHNGIYDVVTTTAPTWAGSVASAAPAVAGKNPAPIVLTANANWQNYRYKVFQTVVPLRNVAWQGVQAGC